MSDEQEVTPPRGRGRPKVDEPRTVTLSIRLKTSEYDALCMRADKSDISRISRVAILRFLNKT